MSQHQMKTQEELEREVRLKIAEEMRIEKEKKKKEQEMMEEIRMRVTEELRIEEQKKREEMERKARRELEDAKKAEQLRLEKLKKKEEEDRKKKALEEEKRKKIEDAKRAEELRIRKQKEEEDRKKKELEEQEKKRKIEEEKKQRAIAIENAKKAEELRIQKQKEDYKKNNPCLFITAGVRMYRHADPEFYYERDALDGKLIGLLFSGSWCQPCLNFIPYLKNFHAQVKEDFEVLFISSDRSEQEMDLFLQNYHGDWYNFEFGSCEGIRLSNNLGVKSIPTLLVFKPNGTYQNVNKTNEVMNCQNPQALVNQWKNM
ncbi:hypothetical protein CAEBREN_29095 [Caenorhabditis brenneri]|uniref:protein-disulfide reductase n=1 Tax=Caenorhabditis brenneri TaxID=135651 RepID=G0MF86_CAEBE|nr:hypothetical protein CAEBREN_29095 [Caenorhabditis brenneri]